MTCNCAGQRWWQDVQKADTVKSKSVTADALKPAGNTSTAVSGAAVKPGSTRPVPAAGAGRAAAAAAASGRPAVRGGQTPARGDVIVKLLLFI